MKSRSLGICLGASFIKAVDLVEDDRGLRVDRTIVRGHESNPRAAFTDLLREIDIERYSYGMLTGRKFKNIVNAPCITEPEALEQALAFLRKTGRLRGKFSSIASLGAESFIVYLLDKEGNIGAVEAGNKCASGTGEFFLQQIRRMDVGVEEAVSLALGSEPYKVSGRCSVFCKSDCTHALNKGVPIGRVTAGLCGMMTDKILDLLDKIEHKHVIAVGGVTRNRAIVDLLRKRVEDLYVPEHADVFEAVGAAYYAWMNKSAWRIDTRRIFKPNAVSFDLLPPIRAGAPLVQFKESASASARDGDECVVGLDVGSTTTKAALLRLADSAIVASVYLRTNGNPVKASRECYWELEARTEADVTVVGIGTTGSGRQIAALHASTDAVVNEILAHATAAAFYDRDVDTIFEIGGQDAKYTFLTGGVPSDYAMNEACSAGTGSFLEEAAKESLGIDVRDIEPIALTGERPLNFNDQCAAFISSDIKTATHEGVDKADIVGGLVYSICMNYVNRVKGQRSTGKKIFMQGGVCYNKAVPLAMANLIGKEIIVPPDPGLLGAFGVALEVKNRIERGALAKRPFSLKTLYHRDVGYGKSFVCAGGAQRCDRKCEISMLIIEGEKYPFGGACNKYYNVLRHVSHDASRFDFVRVRQELLYGEFAGKPLQAAEGPTIGISRSFLTNMLFPLFSNFFARLGCRVVLSDDVSPDGIKRKRTTLCYPGEISHGCFQNLLEKDLDFIFLPKIIELYVDNSISMKREHQCTCLLLQSEPYCLKSAFKDSVVSSIVLSPVIDFSQGWDSQCSVFIELAKTVAGKGKEEAETAYRFGAARQREFFNRLKAIGRDQLSRLEKDGDEQAVVLFGRPYNAFAREANLGIPGKFASAGVMVIPWDFLPIENESCDMDMCWAIGQNLMKAASFVAKHPRLFGAYITNFSCGPDSFLVGYFRDIMKAKPSLTLELDSHTADAGVNTRIEAFLDITHKFRSIPETNEISDPFTPARVEFKKGRPVYISSDNRHYALSHKRVHLVFPSMGRLSSELLASIFGGIGVKASSLPVYDFEALKLGRGNASCKECLPLLLTTGGLLEYLKRRGDPNELLVYFMPTSPGNCRFTQYSVFLKKLIEKNRLRNVALLSLTNENAYAGLTLPDMYRALKAVIVSDVMEDIKNALLVLARDRAQATGVFEGQWGRITAFFSSGRKRGLSALLESVAAALATIPLRFPLREAKKISLVGEIFVRREYFSCQDLLSRLAQRDIVVKRAHFFEWLSYCDYNVKHGIYESDFGLGGSLWFSLKRMLQSRSEKQIKGILAKSGLYEYELVDMDSIIDYGKNFFDVRFTGEAIVVVGAFFKDIVNHVQGVISIGPFACMPTRVIEAVLSAESTVENKRSLDQKNSRHQAMPALAGNLPFLSVESDGNPFPQIIEARIEAFCLQVDRLHRNMKSENILSGSKEHDQIHFRHRWRRLVPR
jgi:predicted CoA-substrate-specific enzyme activase